MTWRNYCSAFYLKHSTRVALMSCYWHCFLPLAHEILLLVLKKKKMQIGLDYFIFRRYSICMPAGMLVWQHPIPEPALLALAQAMCASSWGICLYTMAHSHTGSFPWLSLTLLFCIFNYCAFATLLVPCCCAYVCPTQWAFGKGTLSLSMA